MPRTFYNESVKGEENLLDSYWMINLGIKTTKIPLAGAREGAGNVAR